MKFKDFLKKDIIPECGYLPQACLMLWAPSDIFIGTQIAQNLILLYIVFK